jgi:hypothetical protein
MEYRQLLQVLQFLAISVYQIFIRPLVFDEQLLQRFYVRLYGILRVEMIVIATHPPGC